ncbi:hypothetical protein BDW22DRAFT_1359722 [Trametopsis cervina]|nr:hypothetical protein BDW22DRAFT_1359722 [Trametopsis cervina]
MVVAVAVWSLELKPGQTESFTPPGDLRITNVALGDELADENGRTSVKLTYQAPGAPIDDDDDEDEDEEEGGEPVTTVLCSLTPGKIEQTTIDLILEEDQEVLLESVGKNTVFLTGNYVDQQPPNPFDGEDDYDSEEEDAYNLEDVSSDVEIDPAELVNDSHRFEEVESDDEVPQLQDSKKRPRESDVSDAKATKSQKSEKGNKKLKAESGKAVPSGTAETETKDKKDKKEKKEKEKAPSKAETKELSGGVKVQDHKVGSGPQAKNGDMVSMRYVGKLQNGKVFDSNTKGAPFKFRLGKGEVIKGWDVGIAGMQPGGERLLTIPATMAYGKKAQAGIPANSTLIFEVKLLKIN